MNHALIIDDLAIDRQLAARALKRVGWTVQLARKQRRVCAPAHPEGNQRRHCDYYRSRYAC